MQIFWLNKIKFEFVKLDLLLQELLPFAKIYKSPTGETWGDFRFPRRLSFCLSVRL